MSGLEEGLSVEVISADRLSNFSVEITVGLW
jgi:hypothetical protein